MTREILVSLSPEEVLNAAKTFFISAESGYSGTLVEEGENFARFQTFRGNLAVSASPEDGASRGGPGAPPGSACGRTLVHGINGPVG